MLGPHFVICNPPFLAVTKGIRIIEIVEKEKGIKNKEHETNKI